MPRQPDAGGSRVREKHRVVGRQLAQSRDEEFRTNRFYSRSFLDIVLQQFVERLRLGDVPLKKSAVGLVADSAEQRGDGRLDIADQRQINRRPPSEMLRVLVDLDFFDLVAGKK